MDSRKLKILQAVVDEYIVTGEPVGSKAIMAHVKASSATIRNEMAELEKQGYLEQPHTSAGRIPTYVGFRLYVDTLMERDPLSEEEKRRLDSMLDPNAATEEELVNSASLALTQLTQCASVVASSAPKFSMISKVEVIPTGKRMYVILMITSGGTIRNKVCRLEFDLTHEQLEFFDRYLAENLEGVPVDKISEETFEKIREALGAYMMTLTPLLSELFTLAKEMTAQDIKLRGEKNLLTCKDFDQTEIIDFLDNKREIARFFDDSFSSLQVSFSPESDGFVIHNSSIITAPFKKDGRTAGALGLIGPMRIDYAKFIPYLEYFSQRITDLLTDSSPNDDEENKGG
ncbi:heat-inducible transcription repressor HrcA [Ruminococcus sp. YE71]|uniref:heat-inducible transcriptional repressor HrcA n=1 Tax=unclassified Ruminococcus TaxID=2608920 RepID=UPI000886913B|nr:MULTISPECIES: heat-inducible transcriptional repressor HrcA [unclassified Ruminococcus]SDA09587.1 heat-inducible transcription repressor HrcA [Ruminococcus sp. YE78]SFW11925.1 heat-inducible transcription repressor HrcA [Ruminococcus sp. YE71]